MLPIDQDEPPSTACAPTASMCSTTPLVLSPNEPNAPSRPGTELASVAQSPPAASCTIGRSAASENACRTESGKNAATPPSPAPDPPPESSEPKLPNACCAMP